MPNEDKNIGGSLVLDLRIWWRHVKTLYTLRNNFAPFLATHTPWHFRPQIESSAHHISTSFPAREKVLGTRLHGTSKSFGAKNFGQIWGPFLEGPETFSYPESRSKISNLAIYLHILFIQKVSGV